MKMCVCVWFGTCAYGILHVAVIQLPLSEQEEVIRLRSTPGIVHKTIVWRGCIFLKQPSECKCCLITADGLTLHSTILYSVHSVWSLSFKILTSAPEQAINNIEKLLLKTRKIYSRYICKVNCNIYYLRLLPFGFALLWRLHLLVVIFNKMCSQHVELLHSQWSGPSLRFLICYLQTDSRQKFPGMCSKNYD